MCNVGTISSVGDAKLSRRSPDWNLDPLGSKTGGSLLVDRVALIRIVCVAAETGARMQREGLAVDPLAWMTASLALFRGQPPIEACMDRTGCCKAILLHGLGLELDIDCDELEALIDVDELGREMEVAHV